VVLLWQVLLLLRVLLHVVVSLPGHHLHQQEPLLLLAVVLPQQAAQAALPRQAVPLRQALRPRQAHVEAKLGLTNPPQPQQLQPHPQLHLEESQLVIRSGVLRPRKRLHRGKPGSPPSCPLLFHVLLSLLRQLRHQLFQSRLLVLQQHRAHRLKDTLQRWVSSTLFVVCCSAQRLRRAYGPP
jgi:hypothetical protein